MKKRIKWPGKNKKRQRCRGCSEHNTILTGGYCRFCLAAMKKWG